jgi:hypothetical protein
MLHVSALKDWNPKFSMIDKLITSRKIKKIALGKEWHMKRHRES